MIGIDVPEFNRGQEKFRNRMLQLVRATRAQAKTEVRRHSVRMRALARSHAPQASRELWKQITERYENDGLTGIVTSAAPYAQFVEGIHHNYLMGRAPGRWPPPEPIRKWVQLRGLASKWRVPESSAVFLVRRKIGKLGTSARPHMKPAFEQVAPEFDRAMARVFNRAAQNIGVLAR